MKYLGLMLLALALVISQLLIGGARMLYSLPAFCLVALAAIVATFPPWRRAPALPWACLGATVLFAGCIFYRNAWSPVEFLARPDFFLILAVLATYLLTVETFNESKTRLWIVLVLCALAAAHVAVGAIQFKEANQFMPFPWIRRTDDWWRASGFYISPNHFAGLLEIVALLALSVTVWSKRHWVWKALAGYVSACCVLGVAISGSRGGYLSLSFGFLCWVALSLWAYRRVNPHRWWLATGGAVVGLVLFAGVTVGLMFQSTTLKDRFTSINDPENMRFLLWHAALEQFRLNPTWGTGSGTYLYHGRTFRNPSVQNDPVFVHNDYLHLLAEYGVIGVAAFGIFFFAHGVKGLRSIPELAAAAADDGETNDGLALHLGALSAIATYTAHSVFDFNLHIPANALVMAFVFGMVASPSLPRPVAGGGWLSGVRLAQALTLAIAGIILWRAVPLLPAEWYAEWSRQALRDRRLPEARAFAARGLKHDPGNPELYYYAGEAAREIARLDTTRAGELGPEAIRLFEEGLKVFPFDSRLMLKLAQAHDQLRNFEEAEQWLERASEIDPNSMYVHSYRGMHYQAQGLLLEAETEYELALEYDGHGKNTIARAGLEEVRKALAPTRAQIQREPPLVLDEEPNPPARPDEAGLEIVPIR